MKEDLILIETYHGIDICFNKGNSKLSATNPKTGEEFGGHYVFEVRDQIDNAYWEEVKEYGYIKSGYFDREISKVQTIRRNRKTRKCVYKILDTTDSRYEVGRLLDQETTIYPVTDHNKEVYQQVDALQNQITELEQQQRRLVATLEPHERTTD